MSSVQHLEVGVFVEDLGLSPEAGASNKRPCWQVSQAAGNGRNERVPHILTRQIAGQDCAGRQVGGHILQTATESPLRHVSVTMITQTTTIHCTPWYKFTL